MQNNLHIIMNSFRFGSRILKETDTLVRSGLVRHVFIVAIHEKSLKEQENIDRWREVWRIRLRSRKWPRILIVQLIKYLEFCLRVVLYVRRKNVKIINVHSLPLLPLGVFLKWIYRTKLVYDAHELETETYGLCGIRQSIAKVVELNLIKYADLIIVVGDSINRWYREKYCLSNIVTVLNCPEYQEVQSNKLLHEEFRIPEWKKIVIYQGGLERGRGIDRLLKSFVEHNDDKYALVLMGYGELEPIIREYAGIYDNIFLKEAVEPEVVLRYTASANIGISYIDNPSMNDYFCLPNKLFEYIMAGLPVIVNNAPEMRRIVNDNQIGIVLEELTSHSLGRALEDLTDKKNERLSKNLRRAGEIFSWNNQAQSMIRAYRKFVLNNED